MVLMDLSYVWRGHCIISGKSVPHPEDRSLLKGEEVRRKNFRVHRTKKRNCAPHNPAIDLSQRGKFEGYGFRVK